MEEWGGTLGVKGLHRYGGDRDREEEGAGVIKIKY